MEKGESVAGKQPSRLMPDIKHPNHKRTKDFLVFDKT